MRRPKPSRDARLKAKFDAETARVLARGELRHDCLVRAKYLCEACGDNLATAGFEWHHVVSGSGKREENESLQTTVSLCVACHRKVHESDGATLQALLAWAARWGYSEAYEEIARRMSKFRRLEVAK